MLDSLVGPIERLSLGNPDFCQVPQQRLQVVRGETVEKPVSGVRILHACPAGGGALASLRRLHPRKATDIMNIVRISGNINSQNPTLESLLIFWSFFRIFRNFLRL